MGDELNLQSAASAEAPAELPEAKESDAANGELPSGEDSHEDKEQSDAGDARQ